jgi:hypothetical protein
MTIPPNRMFVKVRSNGLVHAYLRLWLFSTCYAKLLVKHQN